ncbi:hypothetical protein K2X14_02755 [Acetobacter sp. TBRC 12305]|uniref:Lipoprotein n=1 Tax=Acetobacter garciniae TaxID=2817435 RepID=A0A939HN88_9PROT|nr:hypothetical protein [Acetobacter garciniae]MBO1324076.1 hypothetical protein [Acetobacter garciniae]MBX0343765.1 hypothetical protein [Acetobacter garciniae]
MRKAALLGLSVLVGGCSGFGKFLSDTVTLPGDNPNTPSGSDLNMRRVRGFFVAEPPVLPQAGNVWPGPPPPLPSLADVARQRGTAPLENQPQMSDGQEISIGRQEKAGNAPMGSGPLPLPNPVYHETIKNTDTGSQSGPATIEIPNGDGTVTIIAPDGSISTRGQARTAAPH